MLIMLTSILFAYLLFSEFWISAVASIFIISYEVYSLIKYVNHTNYSIVKFLDALKEEDYSVYFSPSEKGASFKRVYEDFNLIIGIFKRNNIEKEAQYKHFKQILEQVNLGIISIHKDDLLKEHSDNEILFLNKAACTILGQPRHKYWHRFATHVPWFAEAVIKLKEGGKILLSIDQGPQQKQLSLEVLDVKYVNTPYLFITFQDIKSEIAQKEIEAWHNVIRVLAHEMLNSFTPVSSLASTIVDITSDVDGNPVKEADAELISDIHLAAKTINKRSIGLLDFVNDYRTISSVPVPQLTKLNILSFITNIQRLLKAELLKSGIQLGYKNIPPRANILADEKLLEQIAINLIGNSIHALEEVEDPEISIECLLTESKTIIQFMDNGKGIPEEIKDQIFIPFFTTRKEGSGIGLSLSKSIMKKHGGDIEVSVQNGKFTTFSLIFHK